MNTIAYCRWSLFCAHFSYSCLWRWDHIFFPLNVDAPSDLLLMRTLSSDTRSHRLHHYSFSVPLCFFEECSSKRPKAVERKVFVENKWVLCPLLASKRSPFPSALWMYFLGSRSSSPNQTFRWPKWLAQWLPALHENQWAKTTQKSPFNFWPSETGLLFKAVKFKAVGWFL